MRSNRFSIPRLNKLPGSRYFIVLYFLLQSPAGLYAQHYLYYLNEDFETVPADHALFIANGVKEDSLVKLDCFARQTKRLVITASFSDSLLTSLHGPFMSFYESGSMEQQGYFKESYRDSVWMYWDSTGNITDSVMFRNGIPVCSAKYSYYKDGTLGLYEMADSLSGRYIYRSFYPNGIKNTEALFVGEDGVLKGYDSTGANVLLNMVSNRKRENAGFPGGETALIEFMHKNLKYDIGGRHGAGAGIYEVVISFTVDTDGTICDIKPLTGYGHRMEKEALRVVALFPKFTPAKIFGIPVKTTVMQRIPFFFL